MANYTMTLDEVTRIQGFRLFEPHDYVDYPHIQAMIMNEFGQQEIAYPAPDMFKRKLNHALAINCYNYNQMLRSQLIQIDPFMTEYIMTEGKDSTKSHEGETTDNYVGNERNIESGASGKTTGSETYAASTTGEHSKQNADTSVKGSLFSEAENYDKDGSRDLKITTTENTDYEESTTETATKDTTDNTNKESTDNQTGRQWTEKGNSLGHNLDVHSDMPQGMLFNTPNAMYGTGREHQEGRLVGDNFEDFPETDPNKIDTEALEMGSSDSPWYNYATTADNKTGHDSYNKEGTETYQKSGSEKIDETKYEDETKQKDIEGHKDVDGSRTETETTHEGEGRTKNSNEHAKQDEYHDEAYTERGTDDRTTDTLGTSENFATQTDKSDTYGKEKRNLHKADDRIMSAVSKGRRMVSPSTLLRQYRETLTFNADLWLLGELEPLFMQIF